MSKFAAGAILFFCLAGVLAAIFILPRKERMHSPSALESDNPIDRQIKRVVKQESASGYKPIHQVDSDSGAMMSTDIEQDWSRYSTQIGSDITLESLVRGASQPRVPEETRIQLAKNMLASVSSPTETIRRLKAVIDVAEATASKDVAASVFDAYPRLPPDGKSIAVARLATIEHPGFLAIAVQCANATAPGDPIDVAALKAGVEMALAIDALGADNLIGLLSPEIRRMIDANTRK